MALAGTIIAGAKTVEARADGIPTISYDQEAFTDYTVKKGDTLGKIAEKYFGNPAYYEYIAKYNNITDANTIYPGQVIKIPDDWLYQSSNQIFDYATNSLIEDNTYTVKKGDTLYCIVRVNYGLKNQEAVDKLATYNNLNDPNKLSVGQILLIPSIDKLLNVQQKDYSEEYNRMGEILNRSQKCAYGVANIIFNYDNVVLDSTQTNQAGCVLILKP